MVAGLTEAPGGTAQSEPSRAARVRTAVIIVHGMGEQVPMETLNGFVRTALAPTRKMSRSLRHVLLRGLYEGLR